MRIILHSQQHSRCCRKQNNGYKLFMRIHYKKSVAHSFHSFAQSDGEQGRKNNNISKAPSGKFILLGEETVWEGEPTCDPFISGTLHERLVLQVTKLAENTPTTEQLKSELSGGPPSS